MVTAGADDAETAFSWVNRLQRLFSEPCTKGASLPPSRRRGVRSVPSASLRNGGERGPETAAWLLNEHGPPLYRSRAPETQASVRMSLQRAWTERLNGAGLEELRAFVQQRLEQIPEVAFADNLEQQVDVVLAALLRADAEIANESCKAAYAMLPSDWARLSEAYQVDFVLHGLPGLSDSLCEYCGSSGHVHVGPRELGMDVCLHVGWVSTSGSGQVCSSRKDGNDDLPEPEAEQNPSDEGSSVASSGRWEPLGKAEEPIADPAAEEAAIERALSSMQVLAAPPLEARRSFDSEHDAIRCGPLGNFTCLPKAACCIKCQGDNCQNTGCTEECQSAKPCDVCPVTAGRKASGDAATRNEGPRLFTAGDSDNNLATANAAPLVSSRRSQQNSSGARFCVLLHGELGSRRKAPSDPCDGDSLTRFREAFVEAVASSASVSRSRVRVLDVGQPLDFGVAAASPQKSSSAEDGATEGSSRTDTGAGVLEFLLGDEEDKQRQSELPSNARNLAANQDAASTTRILAIIREAGEDDLEPSAMCALAKVTAALGDPNSTLQLALRPWSNSQVSASLWGSGACARGGHWRAVHRRDQGLSSKLARRPLR